MRNRLSLAGKLLLFLTLLPLFSAAQTRCADARFNVEIEHQPACPDLMDGRVVVSLAATNATEFVLLWDEDIDPATQVASNLTGGAIVEFLQEDVYIVTASNTVDGCVFSTNFTILARNPNVIFDIELSRGCLGAGEMACADVTSIMGGRDPGAAGSYLVEWNVNGTFFVQPTLCNLQPGNYSVTVFAFETNSGSVVCSLERFFGVDGCDSLPPVMACSNLVLSCFSEPLPLPPVTDDNDPNPRVTVVDVQERDEDGFCRVLDVEYLATDFDGGESRCVRTLRYLDPDPPQNPTFADDFPDMVGACPGGLVTNVALFRTGLFDSCGLAAQPPPGEDCAIDGLLDGAPWTRGVLDSETGTELDEPARLWLCQTNEVNGGESALQAGGFTTFPTLGDNETAWLQTTVEGTGIVCFDYRVSSEPPLIDSADYLRFFIDGVLQDEWAGEFGWDTACYSVTNSNATTVLRWEYAKDDFLSVGDDAAWLDNVFFDATNPPPKVEVELIGQGSGCTQEIAMVYIAEDTCGNQARFTQQWVAVDNEAPQAPTFASAFPNTEVADLASASASLALFDTILSDNCGIATTEVMMAQPPLGCEANVATLVYLAADLCGNTASFTQTFAVGRSFPVVTRGPTDRLLECPESIPNPDGNVAGIDSDGQPALLSWLLVPGFTDCSGRINHDRVYTLVGSCGLATTVTQDISFVDDTEPPEIGVTGTFPVIDANPNCEGIVPEIEATAFDRCSGATNVIQSPAPGSLVTAPQILPVILSATDACGNSIIVTVGVQVVCDNTSEASVSGTVWMDINANGLPDENLPVFGFVDASVNLYVGSGGTRTLFDTRQSGTSGGYVFGNVPPGDYEIEIDSAATSTATFTTPASYTFSLGAGETFDAANFGFLDFPPPPDVKILVWNDLGGDGLPGNDNLANTALAGVEVEITFVGSPPQTFVTDADGCIRTAYLGDFTARLVESTVPPTFSLRSTPVSQAGVVGQDTLFGVFAEATAVGLERVDVEGDLVRWDVAWEENMLGYWLYRQQADGWERVHDSLILATGQGGSYELAVDDPGAVFSLIELTTDLEEVELIRFANASPMGEPVALLEAPGPFPDSATSVLIPNFSGGRVRDVSDPEHPIELLVEILDAESEPAAYFSWRPGALDW